MDKLHSRILGEGRPIIILHGFLGMSDNWRSVGSRYAENGYEVHLVDQRNHGKSFWSDEFNYDVLAEDLLDYIGQQSLEQVILLGHSMGGKTSMQFAANYPDKVEKLMVADIAPKYYPPHHQEIFEALTSVPVQTIQSRVQADEILSQHLSDAGIRQFLLKNLYWIDKGKLAFRFNLEVLKDRMEEVGQALVTENSFDKPTLFLGGGNSDYILEEDLELIHTHFPFAQMTTIDRAGHWLHAENPGQFIQKSLEFINS